MIDRLIAAGLDSVPGGGAEILVDRVRKLLNCYNKASADEWLDVMRHAHQAGLRTTATMMYGTVETDEERLEHMLRLRALQDETGGFTAFITWSYQPDHTELAGVEATGIEYLRTLAIARLVLDNFDNLQASWVTQGGKVGQLSLAFGANDMGSVMIEENVVRAAGASYCMDEVEIVRNVEDAGYVAKRRNMHYDILGDPFFRDHDVTRMLELSTAREAGDTSVPVGAGELSRAKRRGEEAAVAAADLTGLMTAYRAAWICPIDQPPIQRRHRRRRRRPHRRRSADRIRDRRPTGSDTDLGNVALLPGLVNAHTHLELSWLRGRVPPAARFTDWVKLLFAIRGRPDAACRPSRSAADSRGDSRSARPAAPLRSAISAIRWRRLSRCCEAKLDGVVFHELLGFKERDGALVTASKALRDAGRGQGRPRVAGAARAVFDLARIVRRDSERR